MALEGGEGEEFDPGVGGGGGGSVEQNVPRLWGVFKSCFNWQKGLVVWVY